MLEFPVRFFVDFFERHGFLSIDDRPTWRVVCGGSREYVRRIETTLGRRLRLSTPVKALRRNAAGVAVIPRNAPVERFDTAFVACHADQALAMLTDPTVDERAVLTAFPYAAKRRSCTPTSDSCSVRRLRVPPGTITCSSRSSSRSPSPMT